MHWWTCDNILSVGLLKLLVYWNKCEYLIFKCLLTNTHCIKTELT